MPISRHTGPSGSAGRIEGGVESDTERDSEPLAPVTYLPVAYLPGAYLPGVREADARRAENVTLHAITRRGQSRAEVADLLRRRDIDPDVAEVELERLESVGLIDDRALAIDLVDRLRSRKKLGTAALRNELMRRKIDRTAMDEALSAPDEESESEMLEQLAADRARRLGSLDRSTAERRLVDFLARKGHTGSTARAAARRALDGDASEGSARIHRVEFR
jgi:regulatory protein